MIPCFSPSTKILITLQHGVAQKRLSRHTMFHQNGIGLRPPFEGPLAERRVDLTNRDVPDVLAEFKIGAIGP